ncbi:MAG: DUF4432 family protein [Spirochaetales bacterium]|nr:DUF4432 family protein [Spirochaetales bacterium]
MTNYKSEPADLLENDFYKAAILKQRGAKIASIFSKSIQKELLYQVEGNYDSPAAYDTPFGPDDSSGFDDMFPSINPEACPDAPWKNSHYPDHGEVWSLPWQSITNQLSPDSRTSADAVAAYRVYGIRFPYALMKTVELIEDKIRFSYKAENNSPFPLPYLWAAHAIFRMEAGMELLPPKGSIEILNALEGKLGKVGDTHNFPKTLNRNKKKIDLSIIPEKNPEGMQKYYFKDRVKEGICSLHNPQDGMSINLEWNPEKLPYLGIWVNEGGWANQFNIGIEPATAGMDSPTAGRKYGMESILKPYSSFEWSLDISVCSSR